MNLLYGTVASVSWEEGLPCAKIRVGPALKQVSLAIVEDVEPGDTVLVCDGVAIGKVRKETHVPGYSR